MTVSARGRQAHTEIEVKNVWQSFGQQNEEARGQSVRYEHVSVTHVGEAANTAD